MNAFMTSGTIEFLEKLEEKHADLHIRLMINNNRAIAYYEHENKKIFQSGRGYEILTKIGHIFETGYVAMNNIPVREESERIFETLFKNRLISAETMPGFQAVRLLKPQRGNVYIIFSQWASKADYENWKESPQYAAELVQSAVKPPDYFEERPFLNTYHMHIEEEE